MASAARRSTKVGGGAHKLSAAEAAWRVRCMALSTTFPPSTTGVVSLIGFQSRKGVQIHMGQFWGLGSRSPGFGVRVVGSP